MLTNRYYEVVEPIFHFRLDGHRPSNTWIGASRALDPILRGTNAKAGDVFHLLVGGNFLAKPDGGVSCVSFWHPKPLLEKSYGPGNSVEDLFKRFAAAGAVREVPKPETAVDYASARKLPNFAENHPALRYEETSPTFAKLAAAASCMAEMAREREFDVKFYDYHLDRRAQVHVNVPTPKGMSRALEIHMVENGELFLSAKGEIGKGMVEAFGKSEHAKPGYASDTVMWANSAAILDDTDFLAFFGEAFEGLAHVAHTARAEAPRP